MADSGAGEENPIEKGFLQYPKMYRRRLKSKNHFMELFSASLTQSVDSFVNGRLQGSSIKSSIQSICQQRQQKIWKIENKIND
jgi:hypothetical protein